MEEGVPFLDLKAQFAELKDDIIPAVSKVLDSQRFILGENVKSFEKEVAQFLGVQDAIGVSSGSDALLVSLMALGIKNGDEVITSPFTFFATAGSIIRAGAKPVFVDIEPKTFNINPNLIEEKITKKTKAILPVHLFGQSALMDDILKIANKYNLFIVEDSAQAIGAKWNGKNVGSFGNLSAFSFFPSKNLGGFGDGGLVTTNSKELGNEIRSLRNHGQKEKYLHYKVGGNFRLDEIQACVLRIKLKYLDEWTQKRISNAKYYIKRFEEENLLDFIVPPYVHEKCYHVFNQFTIRVKNRDGLKKQLESKNIGHSIYYPLPLHLQPCFNHLGYKRGDLPEAEKASLEVISLPIYPEISKPQMELVIKALKEFYIGN